MLNVSSWLCYNLPSFLFHFVISHIQLHIYFIYIIIWMWVCLINFGGLWLALHHVCCFHLFSCFSLLRLILLSFGHFLFISFCTPFTVSLLPSILLYLQLRYRSYNDSQSIFNTISMFSSFISSLLSNSFYEANSTLFEALVNYISMILFLIYPFI